MSEETLENPSLPGAKLREQRERKGLTTAQLASELHVARHLLEALEENRFEDIGAPIFVKGHLRNYGRLLGLDANELVAAYEAAHQPSDPTLVAHRPDGPIMEAAHSQAWVGWFGWLFLLVLAILLGGWWYYEQEGGGELVLSPASEPVSIATPTLSSPPEENLDAAAQSGQAPGSSEQAGAGEPAEQDGDEVAAPRFVMPESPVETTATEPQPQPPAERASTPPADGQGLVLAFAEESWVEVYDAAGRPILYDLMAAGTRRTINASGELRVFLGNADGVEVSVAGEPFDVSPFRRRDSTARFTVNVPAGE
ncbi:MAG TPA: RodZ domain-containing protein [Gammaproteobacteria bacterium]